MNEFIEKLIGRLEELKQIERKRSCDCDEEGYGDAEQIYDDGRSQGRYEQTNKIIEIVNQLAEEYNNESVKGDLISRSTLIEELNDIYLDNPCDDKEDILEKAIGIVDHFPTAYNDGWIPCSKRLPERENKYGWVSCIVSVIRSHYPTSTYDIYDAPYDENLVMHANYDVSQKIWHLDCDEQLNALIGIEDAPLNSDYVIAWQPLPAPYQPKGE